MATRMMESRSNAQAAAKPVIGSKARRAKLATPLASGMAADPSAYDHAVTMNTRPTARIRNGVTPSAYRAIPPSTK
jgi:hypothetical protein